MRAVRWHVWGAAASVVAGLTGLSVSGQVPGQAPPAKPGTAIILGRVVEAGTTVGVPGAVVTIYGPPMPGIPGAYIGAPPGGPRRIATDSQGNFIYRDLPAGSFSLSVTANGHVDAMYGDTHLITIRRTFDFVRTIDITAADRVVPATIQMWRNGGIGGRVLDEAGEPMVGVPVAILARMTDWGGSITQRTATVLTDDRGVYHKDLTPGQYIVGVLASTTTWPAAAVQGFAQAQAEGGATFEKYMNEIVAQGALLPRGVGTRVGHLMVNQMATSNTQFLPPIAGEGRAAFFFPSTFHPSSLTMAAATVVAIGPGEERSGVGVQLRPVLARRVSGRVLGPGGPLPNIVLRLVPQDPSVMRTSPATIIDPPQAGADGSGDFTFVGVAPGAYHLVVVRSPSSATDPLLWFADTVSVGDSDVAGLQVQMQGGGAVSGRVVTESTGAAPPLDRLRVMSITARPVPGSVSSFNTRSATARPDPNLRFVTPQLIPGPYMMTVTNLPPGWVLKSVTSNGQNIVDKSFVLGATGVTDVVVTLTNQIGTVTGIVRDVTGKVAATPTVAVFPADKSLWRMPGMASRRVQATAPDRDGRYSFRGLPEGEYLVVAVDWPGADFSDPSVLTAVTAFAQRLVLTDGESRTQDLRMAVMK